MCEYRDVCMCIKHNCVDSDIYSVGIILHELGTVRLKMLNVKLCKCQQSVCIAFDHIYEAKFCGDTRCHTPGIAALAKNDSGSALLSPTFLYLTKGKQEVSG